MKKVFMLSLLMSLMACGSGGTNDTSVVENVPIKEVKFEEPHCLYLIMTGEQAADNYWAKIMQNPAGLTEYAVNYKDKIAQGPGSTTLVYCFDSLEECISQKASFMANIQGKYSLRCIKETKK